LEANALLANQSTFFDHASEIELPVALGVLVDKIDMATNQIAALSWQEISTEPACPAAYHYYLFME
jgi:hypothetical protein